MSSVNDPVPWYLDRWNHDSASYDQADALHLECRRDIFDQVLIDIAWLGGITVNGEPVDTAHSLTLDVTRVPRRQLLREVWRLVRGAVGA